MVSYEIMWCIWSFLAFLLSLGTLIIVMFGRRK